MDIRQTPLLLDAKYSRRKSLRRMSPNGCGIQLGHAEESSRLVAEQRDDGRFNSDRGEALTRIEECLDIIW